jgi:hypothetical protein
MKSTSKFRSLLAAAVITVNLALTLAASAQAQTEKVLHTFSGIPDGQYPTGGLLRNSAGNLYGITSEGGASGCGFAGCGAIFESSLLAGQWTEKILYAFPGGAGGSQPEGNLVADTAGNFYGVTDVGGSAHGLVYELIHNSDGSWTPSVLYTFTGGSDGANPIVGLVFDKAGNLYGTTQFGGDTSCGFSGCGVVFELSPTTSGPWNETILHTFEGSDGEDPQAPLIFDAAGNLYGSTAEGGTVSSSCSIGCGVIFKMTRSSSGSWTQKIIHTFNGSNGGGPMGNLIFDSAGNLYGTASYGGNVADCDKDGCGLVFELSLTSGVWKQIREFSFNGTNGATPYAGLTLSSAGHIVGTTYAGGNLSCATSGCGVVFRLTPTATSWTEQVLHVFGSTNDGLKPAATVILDPKGNIYGTTVFGGENYGTVFEITP